LFQGKKDLFDRLWIAEQSDWTWQEHPVVVLDFTEISNATPDLLQQDLETRLKDIAHQYGIILETPSLMSKFREVIDLLFQKRGQKVVVLDKRSWY